jgi:hypothetical protein
MLGTALALRDLPPARLSAWLSALAAEAQTVGEAAALAVGVLHQTTQVAAGVTRAAQAYCSPSGWVFECAAPIGAAELGGVEITLQIVEGELAGAAERALPADRAPSASAGAAVACELDDALDEVARLIWRRARAGHSALPALRALVPYMHARYSHVPTPSELR